jgi:hypothetical protein
MEQRVQTNYEPTFYSYHIKLISFEWKFNCSCYFKLILWMHLDKEKFTCIKNDYLPYLQNCQYCILLFDIILHSLI